MESSEKLLFAVLVPHRDCFPVLETYRRNLFARGIDGAFSFPAAAPLALLKRPLKTAELKNTAAELRKNLRDEKIVCTGYSECSAWNTEIRFFGMTLDLPLPAFPPDAVLQLWEKPILAPAIITPDDNPELKSIANTVPELSFRAAALANLALQPVPNTPYSFTWEMGSLHWLPRYYKGNLKNVV